jgi:hypothetical protein
MSMPELPSYQTFDSLPDAMLRWTLRAVSQRRIVPAEGNVSAAAAEDVCARLDR